MTPNSQPFALQIRLMEQSDIQPIADAFTLLGWNKPASQYERYLAEQNAGSRTVVVALVVEVFAGYVTVNWQPEGVFQNRGMPEIQDFNVLPHYRNRGIGSRLLDEAEALVAERSDVVAISVGLYRDYGAAQRLYVQRGYIPDGRGLIWNDLVVQPGATVVADDGLLLSFTKRLR